MADVRHDSAISKAIKLHQSGAILEATKLYQKILRRLPGTQKRCICSASPIINRATAGRVLR